jgi:hypothetical protein
MAKKIMMAALVKMYVTQKQETSMVNSVQITLILMAAQSYAQKMKFYVQQK